MSCARLWSERCTCLLVVWHLVSPHRRDYKVACPAVCRQLSGTLGVNVILRAFALSGLDCHRRRMPGFSWLCGQLVCRWVHGIWPKAERIFSCFICVVIVFAPRRLSDRGCALLSHCRDMSPMLSQQPQPSHAFALLLFLGAPPRCALEVGPCALELAWGSFTEEEKAQEELR